MIDIILTIIISLPNFIILNTYHLLGSQIGRGYPDVTLAGSRYLTIIGKKMQIRNENSNTCAHTKRTIG